MGHETDFTICDFVSDLRAPTPSAAAELSVPDLNNILLRLDDLSDRLNEILVRYVERKREALEKIVSSKILAEPQVIFENFKEEICDLHENLIKNINSIIESKKIKLILDTEKVNALNPLAVMSRGYAIAQYDGKLVKSVAQIKKGDALTVNLADGVITTTVEKITKQKGVE